MRKRQGPFFVRSEARAASQAAYVTHMGCAVIRTGSADSRKPFCKAGEDVCAVQRFGGFTGTRFSTLMSAPRTHLFPILMGLLAGALARAVTGRHTVSFCTDSSLPENC
ncbi:hypothetical protein Q8A73_020865 [Channa argus]|nr:hypothetical protein Q8A73_020865 [Channa argus]